ncbi:MAG TPA: hypothetical protein VJK07_04105 [Candidatus Nanoarchaeia archaeon]|nr:hypothetical protein [Candidatus Nanoarchaeia archaeon]
MNSREISHIIVAIIVLAIIISFSSLLDLRFAAIGASLIFSFIIIGVNIAAKKWAANSLDADVQHEIWTWSRYGPKPSKHLARPIPSGIILPLVLSAFSLGSLKCMSLLTYQTSALRRRAARRFGLYSFTEMTQWHNALIGSAGIVANLLLAFVAYFIPGLEALPKLSAFYAFWNLIPISSLDGTHILFGSRIVYTALAILTIIITLATFIIV